MADWGDDDLPANTRAKPTQAPGWGDDDLKPSGNGSLSKPYDLSRGQSRRTIPVGSYYLDRQGNTRRNENADAGNPIIKGPEGRYRRADGRKAGGLRGLVRGDAGPKRGDRAGAAEEAAGALDAVTGSIPFYRDAQAGFGTVVAGLEGKWRARYKEGESPLSMVPTLRGIGDSFAANREVIDQNAADYRTRRPIASNLLAATGTGATLVVPGGAVATAPTRVAAATRGAGMGALQGGVAGLGGGGSMKERTQNAFVGAGVGAVTGGVLDGLSVPRASRRPVPRDRATRIATRGQDPVAMRARQAEFRAEGIEPALVDIVDDSARGTVRATASRMTPARQVATDFRDARALDLPNRISRQASRTVSNDPRSPNAIRAEITERRRIEGDAAFGAVRDTPFRLDRDAVTALRSPDGVAAIRQAARDAMNSIDPAERAVANRLNRLADSVVDDPAGAEITVGMAQSISKSLLDAGQDAIQRGRGNSGRLLTSLGAAVRDRARNEVPEYGQALSRYADESRLLEASEVGEEFMTRNTDDFTDAVRGMSPDELAVMRASGRRAIERKAGENVSNAPGVARGLATAPEQLARNRAALGPDADRLQRAMGLEERIVRNANDIAPRGGSQTALRNQDAENVSSAISTLAKGARGDFIGIVLDRLKTLGVDDRTAEQITRLAVDSGRTDDVIRALEGTAPRRNPTLAEDILRDLRSRGGRAAGLGGSELSRYMTPSSPRNALATGR